MKKILCVTAFVVAASVSGLASAATTFEVSQWAIPLNGTAPDGVSNAVVCELLSDNVKLTVSANVIGGFACDEVNNLMQVAACHQGGSRNVGVACSSDADLTTPDITDLPPGCSDTTGLSSEPSFQAFTASSAGGVMNGAALSGRCTTDTLSGINWIQ